ncbi:MAG: T9SS type A sorting domain-containing protein [Cytophagales bacterium]|nr:T9SS type A sorting domain-containing protein [Cytophagales bacterium]
MQNFANFHIFPNPFWLNLYIGFNNPNKNAVIHIKISDIVGKTYPQEEKIINEGYNEIKLDMTHLPAGLYYIELYLGGVVYNEKMVKLR